MNEREFRVYKAMPAPEVRANNDTNTTILVGYAAVFNRYSQNLGGFVEEVSTSAFRDTLNRLDSHNVAGLVNHDPNWLLATSDSRTLALEVDGTGLGYAAALDLDDPDAVRAKAKADTGKLRGSSFSFRVLPDGAIWSTTEQGFPLRTLTAVELYDVGPVTFPAYRATEDEDLAVALRSLADQVNQPIERLISASRDGQLTPFVNDLVAGSDGTSQDEPSQQHCRSLSVRRYMATRTS